MNEIQNSPQSGPEDQVTASNDQLTVEEQPGLYKFAKASLITALAMPIVGTVVASVTGDPEGRQYAGLLFILMSVYTIPFIVVSIPGLILGESFRKRARINASIVSYMVSMLASLADVIVMTVWIVGAL